MSGKSSRREIPVAKKLEVLKRYRNGEKLYRLEQDTGFQRAQIKNWLKKRRQVTFSKSKTKTKESKWLRSRCKVSRGRRTSFQLV